MNQEINLVKLQEENKRLTELSSKKDETVSISARYSLSSKVLTQPLPLTRAPLTRKPSPRLAPTPRNVTFVLLKASRPYCLRTVRSSARVQ